MAELDVSRTAYVTGASRGIGAATAVALAAEGYDVALGYQDPRKEKRVNKVAASIAELGRKATPVLGDITTAEGLAAIGEQLSSWSSLNALVLNAAGGLERDKVEADPDYALKVNRDGQLAILDLLMSKLIEGSSVVFVTSHWAHKYGEAALPPFDYDTVASSKWQGERALRDRQDELAQFGSRLLVVTAGLVTPGTFVGDRAVKMFPEFAEQQAAMGNIIPVEDVGNRITQLIENPNLPTGHTEWIGAEETTFMRQSGQGR